ncbi:MAG: hypothetical protein PHT33_11430, partial [bacterium]|nr:hypothetical protein [bacterium]
MSKNTPAREATINPGILSKIKPWDIEASLALVILLAAGFGAWIELHGYRFAGIGLPIQNGSKTATTAMATTIPDLIVSIWYAIAIFSVLWLLLTFIVSVVRAKLNRQQADIEMEGFLLMLPMLLLVPAAAGLSGTGLSCDTQGSGFFACYYRNRLVIPVYAIMVIASYVLAGMSMIRPASTRNSAYRVSCYRRRVIERAAQADSFSLLPVAAVILLGGICLGYLNNRSFAAGSALQTGLIIAAAALVLWVLTAWAAGSYRVRQYNDPSGMKVSLLTIGRLAATFFVIVDAGLLLIIPIREAYYGMMDYARVIIPAMASICTIAGLFYLLTGLILLPERYPVATYQKKSRLLYILSAGLDRILDKAGKIRIVIPTMITVLQNIWNFMTFRSIGTFDKASDLSVAAVAITLLFVVTAQGISVGRIGRSFLGSIIGFNVFRADLPIGIASAAVVIFVVIWAYRFIAGRLHTDIALSRVYGHAGLALLPVSAVAFMLSLLPLKWALAAASVIYPVLMLWALAYMVISMEVSSKTTLAIKSVWSVVALIVVYISVGLIINYAHISLLGHMRVPVVQVREVLADNVSSKY